MLQTASGGTTILPGGDLLPAAQVLSTFIAAAALAGSLRRTLVERVCTEPNLVVGCTKLMCDSTYAGTV